MKFTIDEIESARRDLAASGVDDARALVLALSLASGHEGETSSESFRDLPDEERKFSASEVRIGADAVVIDGKRLDPYMFKDLAEVVNDGNGVWVTLTVKADRLVLDPAELEHERCRVVVGATKHYGALLDGKWV